MKPEQTNPASEPEATEAASSRRDFLKVAGVAAAGVLAGASAVAGSAKPAEAAPAPAAKGGYKSANGIEVPKADAKNMLAGSPFPKGTVLASPRAIGANDRIHVAFVGTGGMGATHVRDFSDDHAARNVDVVGICDLYEPRRTGSKQYAIDKGAADSTCVADADYRRLLELKNCDAVVIATPEHWHAQVSVHAMQAGKHIYCQKPMTRYIDEAFQVHDTALATKAIVQVGSQGCSDARWATAGQAIKSGKIGAIVMGQSSYTRNSANGEWNYTIDAGATPQNLDWERWLGSAPARPWSDMGGGAADGAQQTRDDSKSRFFRFRKYTDYSSGILSDLMPHRLHPFLLASGNPEYPTHVTALGTQLGTDREVPDSVQVLATFPSGWSMLFLGSTVNEQGLPDMIRGHKATIYFGNTVDIKPERPFADEIDAANLPLIGPAGEDHNRHEKNWLDCIRTNGVPNCNIDLATKVQTIICLAEMSIRTGKAYTYDEKTRTYKAA